MASIGVPQARSAAMFHIAAQSSSAISDIRLAAFTGSEIDPIPVTIGDLDGSDLFYDFTFTKRGRAVGFVRVAADSRLSSAIYGIEPSPRPLNMPDAAQTAIRAVQALYPGADILELSFVCYAYPKIGVRVRYRSGPSVDVLIVDYYDGTIISNLAVKPPLDPDPSEAIDGLTAYSIIKTELPEAGFLGNSADFDSIARVAGEILPRAGNIGNLEFSESDYITLAAHFEDHPPVITSFLLPVPLIPQTTPVFCAIASAQMILAFFGFSLSVDQVAAVMTPGPSGTTNSNQLRGYRELSGNALRPAYDASPTLTEADTALRRFAPMKSGVPGHARVCRGSKRFDFISGLSGEILATDHWYLINDPYPVNAGGIRWENIKNHNYQNFIYLDR
jgi:Peptidase_C39 like family